MKHLTGLVSCLLLLVAALQGQDEGILTQGIQVQSLQREKASERLPVRITGVVTFPGPSYTSGFVIDDGTRGVFVQRTHPSASHSSVVEGTAPWIILKTGMRLEVTGVTSSGNFAPEILASGLTVLGEGPLPPAEALIIPNLLTGSYDCQRIRIRGVLQDVAARKWFGGQSRFSLATADGRCEIISLAPVRDGALSLVDAEVDVEGVCFTFFNPRAELAGVRIQISGLNDITVITPAPEDPFSVPEVSLTKLRSFGIEPPPLHRRQFHGTVTLSRPGEFFYVQDGDRGVRVQTQQTEPLELGDEVVVSGFVELQRHYAEVREAVYKKVGNRERLQPTPITRAQVLGAFDGYTNRGALDVDGRLVTLTGRLIQIEPVDSGSRIYLEAEGSLIEAEYGTKISPEMMESLRLGSDVKLTGVCQVELSSVWPAQDIPRVTGLRLMLRNRDDIVVTRLASWWTSERLWKVMAGLFAVFVCALAWALFLRKRVEVERQASVEFSATIRERERLAADLHDTLEQALTGVAFQLEIMTRLQDQPDRSLLHLTMARQILSGSREDVRRSVWNLRSNLLEGRMLRDALEFIGNGLAEGHEIRITTGGNGEEESLPDLIAGNLLMLAKEGITNALKHAQPSLIHLTVDYEPGLVTLTVQDDGCGFDLAKAQGPHQGHFGLQGMRERAARLGGQLEVTSDPGHGTRIVMQVDPRF